jgi:hypothetical protein
MGLASILALVSSDPNSSGEELLRVSVIHDD